MATIVTPDPDTTLPDIPALLNQAREGDAESLRALLERFGGQVWNAIHADIGPTWRAALDADDVMQVTYMEAFLNVARLAATDEPGFVSWLTRIARNNLRDAIRELGRQKRPSPAQRVHAADGDASSLALLEQLAQTTGTPSRVVASREAAETIRTMLDRMPGDYARVVRMYDLEGRDIAAVAKEMGRSAGAVHMLRSRAHDLLRELLLEHTDFLTRTA